MPSLEEQLIGIAMRFGETPLRDHYPDPQWDIFHVYETDGLRIQHGKLLGLACEEVMSRTEVFSYGEQVYLSATSELESERPNPLLYKRGAWELSVDLIYNQGGQKVIEGPGHQDV
jgi:hypothetical protein